MFNHLPVLALFGIFIVSSGLIWVAGIKLAKSTAVISKRFNLGTALGGMIILAIVTDLPEIAIMVGASVNRHIGLVTGNLLGGVSMQTAVLILLDVFGVKGEYPLTNRLKMLTPVLEAVLVIVVLITAIMASQIPSMGKLAPG